MAIRIRRVNGMTVALCAAKTIPVSGDIYLNDSVHHALSAKFGVDWHNEGFLKESLADAELKMMMEELESARHQQNKD